jgi:hypothetical protein
MKMLTLLARTLTGCSHDATYRERRLLHGVQVMHFVCEDCGHAVPAIGRTAGEHADMVRTGAVRMPRAHRSTSTVVTLVPSHRKSA